MTPARRDNILGDIPVSPQIVAGICCESNGAAADSDVEGLSLYKRLGVAGNICFNAGVGVSGRCVLYPDESCRMVKPQAKEVASDQPGRSPANLLAESICSVGYDLARIYCQEMKGEEVLERRCDLGSDEDFVYCARWYRSVEDLSSMRSDMIFYRETDDNFRLHILTRPEVDLPDRINLTEGSIVDGRRSLDVWQRLVDEIVPHSDNVLDTPTGFEDKRASINFLYPEVSWRRHTQVERAKLAAWDGARQLDGEKIEMLHQGRAVSMFTLLGERCRVSDVKKIVDFYRAVIDLELEPEFSRTFADTRNSELGAGSLGRAMLHRKRHEYINGVSWEQLRILARQAKSLSAELEKAGSGLSFVQRYLYRLPLADVSLSGVTAARLTLCFNSFDSQLFRSRLASDPVSMNSPALKLAEAHGKRGSSSQSAARFAANLCKTCSPVGRGLPLIPPP